MQRLSQQSWRSRSPERGRRRQRRRRRRPRQSCFGFFATGQRRFSTSQSQHPLARGRIGRNLRRTFSLRGLLRCRFSLPVFRYTQNTSQYLRGGICLLGHARRKTPSPTTPPSGGGGRARMWVGLFAGATYRADNIFPLSLCHTQPKQSRSSLFLQSSTTFPTDRAAVFTWLLQAAAAEERKTRPTIGDDVEKKSRRKERRIVWTLFQS